MRIGVRPTIWASSNKINDRLDLIFSMTPCNPLSIPHTKTMKYTNTISFEQNRPNVQTDMHQQPKDQMTKGQTQNKTLL